MAINPGVDGGSPVWLDRQAQLNGIIESALVPLIRGKSDHICIIDPPGPSQRWRLRHLTGRASVLASEFSKGESEFLRRQ